MQLKKTYGFCILFLLCGCTNNLDVLAPYKNITVVYALLDQSDTIHYIRVNRGFEGAGNVYTMAQNYDSVNFPVGEITVVLQDYNNGNLVNTIPLRDTTGIPLSPGIFSYPKQVIYYTKYKLDSLDQYNLIITNNKTGTVITGSTLLLTGITVSTAGFQIPFFNITWSTTNPSQIAWNNVQYARVYQMTFRFNYVQYPTSNPNDSTRLYFDWVFPSQTASALAGGVPITYYYSGQTFISYILSNIPVMQGVTRETRGIEVFITGGSDDLNTYILLSQPSLGINQDIPSFTDVKGGIGIFTCRHTQIFYKQLCCAALDTLLKDYPQLNFTQ